MGSQKDSKNIVTYAQLFLGMVLFGSTLPVSKIVTENLPVFTASGLRLIAAIIMLLPFIFKFKNIPALIKKAGWLKIFLISFSGVFLFSVFMMYGMRFASGVAGSIIMSATPAITAFASFIFLKDKMDWKKIASVILAVAGVAIMNLHHEGSGNGGANILMGVILLTLAVCAEASYTLLAKNIVKDIDPLLLTFVTAVISLFMFAVPSFFELSELNITNIPLNVWLSLIWWGAAGMGFASILWFTGVNKVSGSVASGFMGVMSVSSLLLSYIILGEKFEWIHLAGFALVFIGVILISISHAEEGHGH